MNPSPFLTIFLLAAFLFSAFPAALAQNLKTGAGAYKVVINHEEQYSILAADEKPVKGWKETDKTGPLQECHTYIKEVWTDMRPLSIRKMNLPDHTIYSVVINHEEQYSIWPAPKKMPKGWKTVGVKGDLATCTKYIEEVWTDMRPLSLRKRLKKGGS